MNLYKKLLKIGLFLIKVLTIKNIKSIITKRSKKRTWAGGRVAKGGRLWSLVSNT